MTPTSPLSVRPQESHSLKLESASELSIQYRLQTLVEGLLRLMADLAKVQSERTRTDERSYRKETEKSADYMRYNKIAIVVGVSLAITVTCTVFCAVGSPLLARAVGHFGLPLLLQQGFLALQRGTTNLASTAFQTAQMATGSITDSHLKQLEIGPTLTLNKIQSSGQSSQQDRALEEQLRALLRESHDLLISAARSN